MQRWEIVRVFRADLAQPHDKYCICIDWAKRWFLYFNSEPPAFRKAREVVVTVENHEVLCLSHTSYVDTTSIIDDVPEEALQLAIATPARMHGSIAPFVVTRIKQHVQWHAALTEDQRAAILA